MKILLFFALVLCTITTKATNYYFSSVSGDDSRTVIEAQDPSTPWKSLSKLNSFFSSLKPGDSVLLKRNQAFYGTVIINKSGTKSAPIVIGAYGTGADPVITGLVSLTWVSAGKNLWNSNEALSLAALNMVTVNDVPAGMGRWPNLDNGNGGYDTIRTATRNTITDKVGLASTGAPTYFIGSEIVVRTKRWLLDRHPITGKSGSTITFDPSSTNETPASNFGYFIQDNSSVLDRQNEWWYNRSNKTVRIYSNGSPANVSAANLENLLVSSTNSYITVDNIQFKGCNADAISISGGSGFIIQNSTLQSIGRNAIKSATPNCSFLNNNIIDIMSKGVWVKAGAVNNIIRYNNMRNISQILGLGTSQTEDKQVSYSGDGVYIKGNNTTVEYNKFIKIGYAGVHLTKVDYAIVRYNYLDTVCNVFDDGGGIYAYTGTAYTNHGRQISNNIILHGIGAFYGSGVRGGSAAGAGVAGIYNDIGTSDIDIESNTIAYFEKGIFINYGCNRLTVANNSVYNNSNGIQINTRKKNKTRNLIITGNISLAATTSQKALNIYSDDGDILNLFGTINSNYYARPINDATTVCWQTNQGPRNIHNNSLADWHTKYPMYDAGTKKGPKAITNASQMKFEYNATNEDKTVALNGSYIDIKAAKYSTSIVLHPFTSMVLIQTSGSVTDALPIVYLTSPSPNATFVAPASININATASAAGGSITKVEFFNGTILLNTQSTYPYTFAWKNVSAGNYNITAKATDNNGLATTSSTVDVSVTTPYVASTNVAPIVSITNPLSNTAFTLPAAISITAAASDADGSISKVEFFNGTTLLNTQHSAPYIFIWRNTAAGTYTITAKATDNGGLITTSAAVTVSVARPKVAPTVSLTSPLASAGFVVPASIIITATAADADGSIAKVEFFNGTTLLNTQHSAPYTYIWKNAPAGNYSITAKATDNDGMTTSSAAVKISLVTPDIAPAVKIINPKNGAIFHISDKVNIEAFANDSDGTVVKVDFYIGTTFIKTEHIYPYTCSLQNLAPGSYILTAKATDNRGVASTSDKVTIVVAKNEMPVVSIADPINNSTYSADSAINITAYASAGKGSITKVEFYNGSTILTIERKLPYSWNWKNIPAGKYIITAKVYTNDGLTAISTPVSVIVLTSSNTVRSTRSAANKVSSITDTQKNIYKNQAQTAEVSVGPNPASNILSLFTNRLPGNKKLEIVIFTITGRLVKTLSSNTSNQVIQMDVSALTPGSYLIKLQTDDIKISKQFEKL